MKILEVIRQGQIGGGESHLLDLIANFDKKEVEVEVLSFTAGPMIDQLTEWGIRCYIIPTQYPFDFRILRKINRVIRKSHIDLIHAHGSRAASNMIISARMSHTPLIYTVHGWSFHESQSPFVFKLRTLTEKFICKRSQQVICVSQSNLETGLKFFDIPHHIVIENGVDIAKFNTENFNYNLRESLGFKESDYIIGNICRITIQKDPITFLESIKTAYNIDHRIKGLLVGNGDMDQEVDNYITLHNMSEYMIHIPFRKDIPLVLHTIDAFCLSSLWEGLSIVLLEAMAMQKPVIVTPTDGTKDIINNKTNGTIVGFKDFGNMAQVYINYLQNPALAIELGENAHNLVMKRFNSKRVADAVTEIYTKLIG